MYTSLNKSTHEDFLVDSDFLKFIKTGTLASALETEFQRLRDPTRQQETNGIVVINSPDQKVHTESILLR